jgi:hypothetical protein
MLGQADDDDNQHMGLLRTRWVHAHTLAEECAASLCMQYVTEPVKGTSRHIHAKTASYPGPGEGPDPDTSVRLLPVSSGVHTTDANKAE